MNTEDFTAIEADELLEQFAAYEAQIAAAVQKRDAFVRHFQAKIDNAFAICDNECKQAKIEMALIMEQLRRYAATQVTDKRRSVDLPGGTLSFCKQSPRFFFDDLTAANGKDERLIHFVKHNAYDYLKVNVEESVDWRAFKRKLEVTDDGNVFYSETGEVIDGLHAQSLPDKFTVTTSTVGHIAED